jgi:hypothetical protein
MPRLNATWHRSHPMPKHATLAQRLRWHAAHARPCACREMPPAIGAELQKRGIAVPSRRRTR